MAVPKSDREVIENYDDSEMLKRPHLWPGGVLCLKRVAPPSIGGFPNEFGRIRSLREPGKFAVLVVDDVMVPREILPYTSAEAIVADGWRVD